MTSDNLHKAKEEKNDEFYTRYEDIQKEMNAYLEYDQNVFKDKIVLLPCDDPEWSNFTKFFAQNFEMLGLKKLISTSYAADAKDNYTGHQIPYQVTFFEMNGSEYDESKTRSHGKIFTLERDIDGSGKINVDDLEWRYLDGDGDFRSEEVTALRDEADIIITNPAFSVFGEFVEWIVTGNKKFIIMGPMTMVAYKNIFPLIMENKLWAGTSFNVTMSFGVPDGYEYDKKLTEKYNDNKHYGKVSAICWFTNMEHGRRHRPLVLMTQADNLKFNDALKKKLQGNKQYNHFDNYDAIDVPFVDAIPSDYDDVMGVPITFLGSYCPEQFEIIGMFTENKGKYFINGTPTYVDEKHRHSYCPVINGKRGFPRLLIKKRSNSR